MRTRSDPDTGGPEPGTYEELPSCDAAGADERCVDKGIVDQFNRLWDATPNGLYGIENAEGRVGPDEEGFLYGSAQIFFFVLAVGAFISVAMKTGAIRDRHRPSGAALPR